MKYWPDDSKRIPASKLIDDAAAAIRKLYRLAPKSNKDFEWAGYDVGDSVRHVCLPADQQIAEGIAANEDVLKIVLGILFAQGMEQANRKHSQAQEMQSIIEKARGMGVL